MNTYEGVEAVIDKDFASEKLAALIDATLMILTNVERAYINFKEPNEEKLTNIDIETLKRYAKKKVSSLKVRCYRRLKRN